MRQVGLALALTCTRAPSPPIDSGMDAGDAGVDARDAIDDLEAEAARSIGPYETPFLGTRKLYYIIPPDPGTHRLIANLHGVCNPPGYACGYWITVASQHGFLACPEGNTTCPSLGNAPSWDEAFHLMDADLEKAIETLSKSYPNEIDRRGAVLTGFSRGAYGAVVIAQTHPGRWPYLILTEANVTLTAAMLRAAHVRAVALIDGEIGSQIAGARATVEQLRRENFPARFFMMKGAGHWYSEDIHLLMEAALDFVIENGEVARTD